MQEYELRIEQPKDGYRYSVDSILLAEFADIRSRGRVLELGAGCGIISLVLAKRFPSCSIYAVEIQAVLFDFLAVNIRENRLEDRITPVLHDIKKIRRLFPAGSFDHVVTNPPFRHPASGRLCLNSQEALARHEILVDLPGLLDASSWVLRPGGRLFMVYPAERLSYLLNLMSRRQIEPKRIRCVHASRNRQARMVLVQGVKDAGVELRIAPPIFLDQDHDPRTGNRRP